MHNVNSPHNDDASVEFQIQARGLTGPRILPGQIDALMERVSYVAYVPAGTTSTFAHAYLDGKFLLATGHSACVDPNNFNTEIGVRIAMDNAKPLAKHKLWELEGYALFKQLNAAPKTAFERLQEEHVELLTRLGKLNAYTKTLHFTQLEDASRTLLVEQQALMQSLVAILSKRLTIFKETPQ